MERTTMLISIGGIGYPLGICECASHGDRLCRATNLYTKVNEPEIKRLALEENKLQYIVSQLVYHDKVAL